ncbi:hypothetical protein [Amycolatopsis sp. NPDC059657]|uniref:hypothetical protein n=1 Tax=Amycolatopsis sp. NPDC059657 TaxID=3346899 RepID=UPI00366AD00C
MTQGFGGQSPPPRNEERPSGPHSSQSEARELASTAADRGGEVAHTAAEEVKHVAAHTKEEARDLLQEGREQLLSQATEGQRKAAKSLHGLADELNRMAGQADSAGVAADVARQVSGHAHSAARWLEARQPGDLLDEVRGFARRRPGLFLAGAAVTGAVIGRLTRGAVAGHQHKTEATPEPPRTSTPATDGAITPAVPPRPLPETTAPEPVGLAPRQAP